VGEKAGEGPEGCKDDACDLSMLPRETDVKESNDPPKHRILCAGPLRNYK